MIDNIMMNIGAFFLIAGGVILLGGIIACFAWIVGCMWIAASNKWRCICSAESMIFEYKKNRSEYMAWKSEKEADHVQTKSAARME